MNRIKIEQGREIEQDAELAAVRRQNEALYQACEKARAALEHSDPDECWATGPLTGDTIQDLIVCPGCAAISAIDAAFALVCEEDE